MLFCPAVSPTATFLLPAVNVDREECPNDTLLFTPTPVTNTLPPIPTLLLPAMLVAADLPINTLHSADPAEEPARDPTKVLLSLSPKTNLPVTVKTSPSKVKLLSPCRRPGVPVAVTTLLLVLPDIKKQKFSIQWFYLIII